MLSKMLKIYKDDFLSKKITKEEYIDLVKSLNTVKNIDDNLDNMEKNDIYRKIINAAEQGIVKLI